MKNQSKFVAVGSVLKSNAPVLAPVLAILSLLAFQASTLAQGILTPPGAPAPTMKSLDQIEPRIAISSVPINIWTPGSYYLTTNLTGAPAKSGISIDSGNVSIDLNGFTLKGVGGAPYYDGIVIGGYCTNITIRNGAITGWGGLGVNGFSFGPASRNIVLENLKASENGNGGLSLNAGVVRDCVSIRNTGNGFISTQGVLIEHCSSEANSSTGYNLGQGSVIQFCRSVGNPGNGIIAGVNSRVINCVVLTATNGTGIALNAGGTAEGCTVVSNLYGIVASPASTVRDCVVRANQICGIQADASVRVLNNLVEGTGGLGTIAAIRLTSTNAVVDGCQVVNNSTAGIMANSGSTVSGNLIIRNLLRGNTTAYNVSATNSMGLIISTASGISSGIITNSNPWANFSY
jgi:hypothetical protein